MLRNKPDENYEDPADVAAIREAQAHMGDFKLKTAPDYVVPEHLRMDTEKKRFQILTLQGMVSYMCDTHALVAYLSLNLNHHGSHIV